MTDLERVREGLKEARAMATGYTDWDGEETVRWFTECIDFLDAHLKEDARLREERDDFEKKALQWYTFHQHAEDELTRLREDNKELRRMLDDFWVYIEGAPIRDYYRNALKEAE